MLSTVLGAGLSSQGRICTFRTSDERREHSRPARSRDRESVRVSVECGDSPREGPWIRLFCARSGVRSRAVGPCMYVHATRDTYSVGEKN